GRSTSVSQTFPFGATGRSASNPPGDRATGAGPPSGEHCPRISRSRTSTSWEKPWPVDIRPGASASRAWLGRKGQASISRDRSTEDLMMTASRSESPYAAVTASFLGWMLDAFDFFLVVMTLTAIAKDFGTSDPKIAATITITLAMRPVGALIFGLLADRYGRK